LLTGACWSGIAILIKWIKEDLSRFLKHNAMFFGVLLRLLVILLKRNTLKPVDHIHQITI
jgi:hypothetical protein